MPQSKRLTIKQRRWCELVVRGLDHTKAAAQLWPHLKAPKQKGYELWKLPHVREYHARLDAQHFEQAGVTRTEIILGLARIGRFDPRKLEHEDGRPKQLQELDDDTALAIAGIEIEELTGHDGKVIGRVRKYRHPNKNDAWRELATIAGLKREEGAAPTIGPGLTVIVQQGVQVQGQAGSSVARQQRVEVTLPPPSRDRA